MKNRIIALFVTFAMLVPFTPAVAADDNVPRPTVEEILSEYHQKAFEAEVAQQTGSASAYSRSAGGSGKTLEEETVDTLNAAGYEAYNVTSDNYKTLEKQLQTDFSEMGLDPDASYIITISGEENSAGNNSRLGGNLVVPTLPPDGGGGSSYFSHTYNGETYYMRYVTVTETSNSQLDQEFLYILPRSRVSINWDSVDEAIVYYALDAVSGSVPIGSVLSLLSDAFTDENYISINGDSIKIEGRTVWTLQYIQVYKVSSDTWFSTQCSEYVSAAARCFGSTYDSNTEEITFHSGNETHFKVYSPEYHETTLRKNYAAIGYASGMLIADRTYEIDFYLMNEDKNMNYCGDADEIMFTQPHWLDLAP